MAKGETSSQRKLMRRYQLRTAIVMAVYIAVLVPTVMWLNAHPDSAWRVPVALLPLLPILYGIHGVLRYFRNVDELHQRIQLEALAFAFTGTAALVFTYGFLEMAGFPKVSAWWAWTVMGILWGVGAAVAQRRYR